ncbi:MAG: hypothetical protein IKM80_01905 [Bacilli bacterium]|nr:hypothetical protein [Bacilli bacterium]
MSESEKIKLLLVTGCSGAGKTTVASVAESLGYYIVEQIPSSLALSLIDVFKKEPQTYGKVALFVNLDKFERVYNAIKEEEGIELKTWGLDCSFDELMSRFRLTRHIHPLQPKGYTLEEAIGNDRTNIDKLRPLFDIYIDTTSMTEKYFRAYAGTIIGEERSKLFVFFSSFGFKYGLPRDSEIVIDARLLPNPYWVKELRPLTGLDQPIKDYLEQSEVTSKFLNGLFGNLDLFFEETIK